MRRGLGRALAALAAVALLAAGGPAAPARATTTVLYDGAVAGQTPADQGYLIFQSHPDGATAATPVAGGTALNTLLDPLDPVGVYAGYGTPPFRLPALRSGQGYTLTFTAQLLAEQVVDPNRAGFSVILLGDDRRGIELAFWSGEVWAQNDGANDPAPGQGLFTRGEGAAFDTTAEPASYTLVVKGDGYRLLADGAELLAGPLRRYDAFNDPDRGSNGLRAAYYIPNIVFLGDNTRGAGAEVLLTAVAVATAPPDPSPPPPPPPTEGPAPARTPRAYLPAVSR